MVSAATSAASAPDITAGGTIASGLWDFDVTGPGVEQWIKVTYPSTPLLDPGGRTVISLWTEVTADFHVSVYVGNDPADLFDSFDYVNYAGTQGACNCGSIGPDTYVKIVADSPVSGQMSFNQVLNGLYLPLTTYFLGPLLRGGHIHVSQGASTASLTTQMQAELNLIAGHQHLHPAAAVRMTTQPQASLDRGTVTVDLAPGAVRGTTQVQAGLAGTLAFPGATIQDPQVSSPGLVVVPELGDNDTIDLAFVAHGTLLVENPELADDFEFEALQPRSFPLTVLDLPTPAIAMGLPTLPKYWAISTSSTTAIEGPSHIHSIPDPDPVWDPNTSGWYTPPPPVGPAKTPSAGDARWTVQTLPDPGGGYYWLGDPSGLDGTLGIAPAARQWGPDASTPYAPSWRSFFPYKPSVRAHDSYLPGGNVVHHPKGVHMNSQFIEHMFLDWGHDIRQPATYVVVAMIASFPTNGFVHHILDAGRNPDDVGFPRIADYQTGTPRQIADNLPYRTQLSARAGQLLTSTSNNRLTQLAMRLDANIRPKMFFTVMNGGKSIVGAYDIAGRRQQTGALDNGPNQHHRFLTLGRSQNWIAQNQACHLLVFEIRVWHSALSTEDLYAQYAQLSSTYKFGEYRAI